MGSLCRSALMISVSVSLGHSFCVFTHHTMGSHHSLCGGGGGGYTFPTYLLYTIPTTSNMPACPYIPTLPHFLGHSLFVQKISTFAWYSLFSEEREVEKRMIFFFFTLHDIYMRKSEEESIKWYCVDWCTCIFMMVVMGRWWDGSVQFTYILCFTCTPFQFLLVHFSVLQVMIGWCVLCLSSLTLPTWPIVLFFFLFHFFFILPCLCLPQTTYCTRTFLHLFYTLLPATSHTVPVYRFSRHAHTFFTYISIYLLKFSWVVILQWIHSHCYSCRSFLSISLEMILRRHVVVLHTHVYNNEGDRKISEEGKGRETCSACFLTSILFTGWLA